MHSRIITPGIDLHVDFFDTAEANLLFEELLNSLEWQTMMHCGGEVPRKVAVQAEIGENGETPIYRHPAEKTPPTLPFNDTVRKIARAVESRLNLLLPAQKLNHALIQLYSTGKDFISEHSDKSLDMLKGSYIINVSLGAEREMTLRSKRDSGLDLMDPQRLIDAQRLKEQFALPHNSVVQMSLDANAKWLHAIRADKREEHQKSQNTRAFAGKRISLTFRSIGTFVTSSQKIYGKGAKAKTLESANCICEDLAAKQSMLEAFGKENRASEIVWDSIYSSGFDCISTEGI